MSLIVLNKTDLHNRLAGWPREVLACFSSLGLRHPRELTAHADMEAFAGACLGISVSWAVRRGKPTLTNAPFPKRRAATSGRSGILDSGKHTTTFARMYRGQSSQLIDCPGLQTFGLAHLDQGQLLNSFREFRPFIGTCRFRDCRHDAEPGCALLVRSGGRADRPRDAGPTTGSSCSELEAEAKRLSQGYRTLAQSGPFDGSENLVPDAEEIPAARLLPCRPEACGGRSPTRPACLFSGGGDQEIVRDSAAEIVDAVHELIQEGVKPTSHDIPRYARTEATFELPARRRVSAERLLPTAAMFAATSFETTRQRPRHVDVEDQQARQPAAA